MHVCWAVTLSRTLAGCIRQWSLIGPFRSPMESREAMAPTTVAMPALPMSAAVRLRLSRMTGRRGGAGGKVHGEGEGRKGKELER